MRRTLRWTVRIALLLIVVPVLAVPALWGALNTDPGRRGAEWAVEKLTDGQVALHGVTGSFPQALRATQLEVRDPHGTWLTADNVALDLEPKTVLSGVARVTRLTATGIVIARTPHYGDSPEPSPYLPVHFLIENLVVDRLHVAERVIGVPVDVAVTGHGTLDSRVSGVATLAVHPSDGAGTYHVEARVDDDSIDAKLSGAEPAHGLLAAIARLPDLGALKLTATVDGPWRSMASKLALTAGDLVGSAEGHVDLMGEQADLDVAASAPAMAPRDDLSWQAVSLEGHVHGPWTGPRAQGKLAIAGLAAAGVLVRDLNATVGGDLGAVSLNATAEDVRLPGKAPDLLGAAPVMLQAEARLDDPTRPVTVTLTHPLLSAKGTAQTEGELKGGAEIDLHDTAALTTLGVTLPNGLLGTAAHLSVAGSLHDDAVTVSQFVLGSGPLSFSAQGEVGRAGLDVTWQGSIADISGLSPSAHGAVLANGRVQGPLATPTASIVGDGTLDGAPVELQVTIDKHAEGGFAISIGRADWKSAHAEGALTLSAAADLPAGRIALRVGRLGDLSRLLDQQLAGAISGEVFVDGPDVRVKASATGVTLDGSTRVASAALNLAVRDALRVPDVAGSLDLSGLDVGGLAGSARIEVAGLPAALAVKARTALTGLGEATLAASATAKVNLPGRIATLATLDANWNGETLRLLAPTRIALANGLRLDRPRLDVSGGVVEVAGRLGPRVDLTASIRGLPARVLDPGLAQTRLAGTIQADATLSGTPDRLNGRLHLSASGLHPHDGPAATLPPASITADAVLTAGTARVTATASAGKGNVIHLTGTMPLPSTGGMNLHATGTFDLATLDPLLAGEGERARGLATLDAAITGRIGQPSLSGTVRVRDGDFRDFEQGVEVTGIEAMLQANGQGLRIVRFTGHTQTGNIALGGTLGLGGKLPVDLILTGKNARPIATDLLTAQLDLDLALKGDLLGALAISGTLNVVHADINVPERLPERVAVLKVHRHGQATLDPGAGAARAITLDVTMVAPGQIFLRGRGLDVELEGRITVTGTTTAPVPAGTFMLRRGTVSLAGETLTFTSGEVGFDGKGGLDPTLNLVASSTNSSITATMTITGYASAPKIALTSVPQLPPDEVMAQLLFRQSATTLSPVQVAQGAIALGQFTGVGGGFDPVSSVRRRLGLDRLSVGSATTGNGTTVEAGRYIADGLYVGAKRDTSTNSTQATVQIDLTRHLKLEATAGTNNEATANQATATTAATQPSGSSVGLTYQFDY
jgi:translocation and assembly module TamB